MSRENNYVESYKALVESRTQRQNERDAKIRESAQARTDFMDKYYNIRESREARERELSKLIENCKNNALSTAMKAIYLTALEYHTLTDKGIMLAESMVDNWIAEKGGASAIISECKNKTYLLSRICQITEDAAKEELEEIDKSKNDDGKPEEKEEPKEDKDSEASDTPEPSDEKPAEEDSEKKEEETPEEPEKEEAPAEESEKEADPLNTTFDDEDEENVEVPDDATTPEDDNETDVAEDIVDDLDEVPEEDLTVDGDSENKGRVFEELDKEEDVQKAIELIRQRVADAEETFIKRNAEDKKQIDELIERISDNVKTVEDMDEDAKEEDKVAALAQESARYNQRRIKDITENRPLSVLEKMTRIIHSNITKDTVLREQYLEENGQMDTSLVVETAKVMYGFMETLNTLQLEKVDAKYIEKVLNEM